METKVNYALVGIFVLGLGTLLVAIEDERVIGQSAVEIT